MYEKGIILLDNWQKGIADSPYLGNASIVGCNVFETPGVLKIENSTTAIVTVTGLPIARVKSSYGDDYLLTDDGKFYKNGTMLNSGLTYASDMIIYKGYILITSAAVIHAYGPLSGPIFTVNWKNLVSSYNGVNNFHKMVVANDLSTSTSADAVYITDGNVISKITGFVTGGAGAPPSAGTVSTVLTLPNSEIATTMALLGNKLMIGTKLDGNRTANIYPWDKLTTHSFDNPVSLNEVGINSLLTDGNKMYVSAGIHGNIYVTDGTNYRIIRRIPFTSKRAFGETMTVNPNAMAIHSNGNLLVGTSSLSSTSTSVSKHGVYEINVNTSGYPCALKCIISTGVVVGINGVLKIGLVSMLGSDESIYIGWNSGTTYGFDQTVTAPYTGYLAQVESSLMVIADQLSPKTFKNLEFKMGSPLLSGQGVKVEYRKHVTDTYVTIATFDYATYGGITSTNTKALIADAEQLQFRVSMTVGASPISGTEPELVYIKIW